MGVWDFRWFEQEIEMLAIADAPYLQFTMARTQSKCFGCYKELLLESEKEWLDNDGLCPNCATILSVDDETCFTCNKPAIQEDQILFCSSCFELFSERDEEDDNDE
jgi:hypothetical protein